MDDLLASFDEKQPIKKGTTIKGTVIGKTSKMLTLDVGGKGEGMVVEKAYAESRGYIKQLKIGDEVNAYVLVSETPDGYVRLTLRNTARGYYWKKIKDAKAKNKELVVTGRVVSPAGITVDVEGLVGFIPSTQLGKEAAKKPQELMNMHFKVVVLEMDEKENKLILSERKVSDKEDIGKLEKAMKKIKEGEILTGEVTNVTGFGCFVKLEIGKVDIEGLVHISEFAWEKVGIPSSFVSVGDRVKVKVIGKSVGKFGGDKLSLSMKQASKDPWEKIGDKYEKDAKLMGKVTKVSDFGVFVQLEPGVEGLIHMTKIPPGEKYERGSQIKVYIEDIDPKEKKISLGLVLTVKPVGYK